MSIHHSLSVAEITALHDHIREKFSALSLDELHLRHAALVRVKDRFMLSMKLANWQYVTLCIDHCHERIIDLATDGMSLDASELIALEAQAGSDLVSEHRVSVEVESKYPDADFREAIETTYSK